MRCRVNRVDGVTRYREVAVRRQQARGHAGSGQGVVRPNSRLVVATDAAEAKDGVQDGVVERKGEGPNIRHTLTGLPRTFGKETRVVLTRHTDGQRVPCEADIRREHWSGATTRRQRLTVVGVDGCAIARGRDRHNVTVLQGGRH